MVKKNQKKKNRKKPHPALDYLLYLLVRMIAIFFAMLDVNTSVRLARFLGSCLYQIYPRGRQRAIENLRLSFPQKDPLWIEQTARRSFEHIVMLAFDVFHTTRLIRRSTWRRYIELGDLSAALRLILQGRGVILVGGHYGNFLVLGHALATFGLEGYSIARPIDNPYLGEYLYINSQPPNHHIIYKNNATENMLNLLAGGATLSFIADQNAGRKGIFVDFFGRKASTYKSIGLLAMQYNLPIIVGYCRRVDDQFKFKIGLTRIIQPRDWQDKDDPLYWITAQYTAAIEQFIRQEPQQYWWVHRRWKTRPAEEKTLVATPAV